MALARFRLEADGVLIEGEGVVTVVGGPPADVAGAIVAFLSAIDAVTLERDALAALDWSDGDTNFTHAVLSKLRDYATGKAPVER